RGLCEHLCQDVRLGESLGADAKFIGPALRVRRQGRAQQAQAGQGGEPDSAQWTHRPSVSASWQRGPSGGQASSPTADRAPCRCCAAVDERKMNKCGSTMYDAVKASPCYLSTALAARGGHGGPS